MLGRRQLPLSLQPVFEIPTGLPAVLFPELSCQGSDFLVGRCCAGSFDDLFHKHVVFVMVFMLEFLAECWKAIKSREQKKVKRLQELLPGQCQGLLAWLAPLDYRRWLGRGEPAEPFPPACRMRRAWLETRRDQ